MPNSKKQSLKKNRQRAAASAAIPGMKKILKAMGQRKKSRKSRTSKGRGSQFGPTVNASGTALRTRTMSCGVKFASAPEFKGRSGLRLQVTAPYVNVSCAATSVIGDGILTDAAGTPAKIKFFDPNTSSVWLNKAVPLLTGCFARYKIPQLTFHYRQKGASTSERAPAIMGWLDDTNHPAVTTPTVAAVESLQHNIEFNLWEDRDLPVRIDSDFLHFSAADGGFTNAGNRLSYPGTLFMLQEFASTNATVYGTMYVTLTIDLYDFSPIYSSLSAVSSVPPPDLARRRAAVQIDRSQADDDEVKSVDYQLVNPPGRRFVSPARPLNG